MTLEPCSVSVCSRCDESSLYGQPRRRAPRRGPEADLVARAVVHGLGTGHRGTPVLFQEPELPTGFPDLVAVYARRPHSPRAPLTERHLRVMHHLHTTRGGTVHELAAHLALSERALSAVLNVLREVGLARIQGARVSPCAARRSFPVRAIVAVEAKVRDWRSGLHQAQANQWFASESYLLLPIDVCERMVDSAAALGVGVLGFDGKRTTCRLAARKFPIPQSYGSWLASEWLLHEGLSR
jgi:hypothetical protein